MKIKVMCAAICGVLAAGVVDANVLVKDEMNAISVNEATGRLVIEKFDGIVPQDKAEICEDAFSVVAMEKGGAKNVWCVKDRAPGRVTIATKLDGKKVGIDLDGVEFEKTFEFVGTVPEVRITCAFKNPGDQARYIYFGQRNDYVLRKNTFENIYLPREIGTFPHNNGLFLGYYSTDGVWYSTFVEPWVAKVDSVTKNGFAFIPCGDVKFSSVYAGIGKCLGFMLDGGYLNKGETKKIAYKLRSVKKMSDVTSVNDSFACNFNSLKDVIVCSFHSYENGEIVGTMKVIDKNKKELLSKDVKVVLKKGETAFVNVPQKKPEGHSIVLFEGTMNGKKFATEQYCENGVRMQPLPAVGFAPIWSRELPVESQNDSAGGSDAGNVVRKNKAVCFFGLYTNFNRFEKVFDGWEIENYSVRSPNMTSIPPASTIHENKVMIIGNAYVKSLGVCLPRVKSFVENGGTLIVCGGTSAFGCGAYEKNAILRELTGCETKAFDLRPPMGDDKFNIGVKIEGAGIAKGKEPSVYWMHKGMKFDEGTEVLWTAGGAPLLTKRRAGKGTVFNFFASPMGDPQDGGIPYWESDEYVRAMRNAVVGEMK